MVTDQRLPFYDQERDPIHDRLALFTSVVGHKMKSIQVGEDQIKVSLFVGHMIGHTESPQESTKTAMKTNSPI